MENLATFNHYVRTEKEPKELVIYTAGFPSPSFFHLYRMLNRQLKDAVFRHWSDIDEGGFRKPNRPKSP
ncbi:Wadjet anti-phage system protein JetD domain-containing protein [Oligella urethralis]|uniref:Wadjet anti-phage system protein JetD domain-containing protein n=1 Tax=Oligella urethralis TaxID=90245 RepID=UPI0009DA2DDF